MTVVTVVTVVTVLTVVTVVTVVRVVRIVRVVTVVTVVTIVTKNLFHQKNFFINFFTFFSQKVLTQKLKNSNCDETQKLKL